MHPNNPDTYRSSCYGERLASPIRCRLYTLGNWLSRVYQNLTTNNVAQNNIGFQNMTILTPSTPVSLNDTYGVSWQNIYMPQIQTYSAELFYNEWSAKLSIHDNPLITVDAFELPLSSYLTLGPTTPGTSGSAAETHLSSTAPRRR